MVEQSTHYPKTEGSNPAYVIGSEKIEKKDTLKKISICFYHSEYGSTYHGNKLSRLFTSNVLFQRAERASFWLRQGMPPCGLGSLS